LDEVGRGTLFALAGQRGKLILGMPMVQDALTAAGLSAAALLGLFANRVLRHVLNPMKPRAIVTTARATTIRRAFRLDPTIQRIIASHATKPVAAHRHRRR
jgi:hypothetical protein